jgi:hypothetical protein
VAFQTLALAIRYAAGVQTPTSTTKPTLTNANEIHADQYQAVRAAMVAAELDPDTITASSILEQRTKAAEAYLTSAEIMLAKESLGEQAIKNSDRLRKRGEEILVELKARRGFYLTSGGSPLAAASGWTGSHFADDRDTTIDQTPGTGDVPYAAEAVYEWTDDD